MVNIISKNLNQKYLHSLLQPFSSYHKPLKMLAEGKSVSHLLPKYLKQVLTWLMGHSHTVQQSKNVNFNCKDTSTIKVSFMGIIWQFLYKAGISSIYRV